MVLHRSESPLAIGLAERLLEPPAQAGASGQPRRVKPFGKGQGLGPEVFVDDRRGVIALLGQVLGEVGLGRLAADSKRQIRLAQPAGHEQVERRRTWPRDARHRDVARQPAPGTMQVGNHRAHVRLGLDLRRAHLPPRQRIRLAQKVVVAIVRVTPQERDPMGLPRHLGHRLGEPHTRQPRLDRAQGPAHLLGCVGLGVERVDMRDPSRHPEHDHRLRRRLPRRRRHDRASRPARDWPPG